MYKLQMLHMLIALAQSAVCLSLKEETSNASRSKVLVLMNLTFVICTLYIVICMERKCIEIRRKGKIIASQKRVGLYL